MHWSDFESFQTKPSSSILDMRFQSVERESARVELAKKNDGNDFLNCAIPFESNSAFENGSIDCILPHLQLVSMTAWRSMRPSERASDQPTNQPAERLVVRSVDQPANWLNRFSSGMAH